MTTETNPPGKKCLLSVERKNAIAYRILAYSVAKDKIEIASFKGFIPETSQRTGIAIITLEKFATTFMANVVAGGLAGHFTIDPPTAEDGLTAYLLLQAKATDQRFRVNGLKSKLANLVKPVGVSMPELKRFAVVFLHDLTIRMLADDEQEASELVMLTM